MTMENLISCPSCKARDISRFIDCKDHFISSETFSIFTCSQCGLLFTNPRPTLAEAGKYYESEKYISHSGTRRGLINKLYHLARLKSLKRKKNLVEKHSNGKTILDYGCGTGEFLNLLHMNGWQCHGIEPNPLARNAAIGQYGLEVDEEEKLDSIKKSSLHCISLWHVLEHVYPLKQRTEKFHALLNDEGILILALPNHLSYDANKYGSYWAAWDVPRHLYHFNPSSIQTLMNNSGFSLIAKYPMRLDAFYISLLSEKYSGNKFPFPSAMLHGCLSNFSALFGKGHYSSLIYIFRKSN
jgi:SAM-dependent methyltransferase